MSIKQKFIACGVIILMLVFFLYRENKAPSDPIPTTKAKKQSFAVGVRTIGELEAAQSLSISSLIRSDNGKIIHIIPDGTNVQKGDLLVKLDPTPFEEKLETLRGKLKEQEGHVAALQKLLEWEISQAEKDEKTALFEIEGAELELNKILQGDGPLECARLKGAMNKAFAKYEEFQTYCQDLDELQKEGYLNPVEVRNAEKKLNEEKESYEAAKLQHESYVNHVYPMQVKKGEAALKQAKMRLEETAKVRSHAIGKAKIDLAQGSQNVAIISHQFGEAERDLALTEIKATSPGIVVQREDYRSGQRRKPRIGDVLVRNQVILDLPDLSQMTVKSKVREIDLCQVEIGKKALVEVDAYPQLAFTGKITSIGVLALPDPGKPTDEKYFEIRIHLDKSDPRIRPGMTARISIHSAQADNVLAIPIHALYYDHNKSYCYISSKDGWEKRGVVTGLSNEEWVEIKSGVKEGELVCLCLPKELP